VATTTDEAVQAATATDFSSEVVVKWNETATVTADDAVLGVSCP
jgi:hypothetical protein